MIGLMLGGKAAVLRGRCRYRCSFRFERSGGACTRCGAGFWVWFCCRLLEFLSPGDDWLKTKNRLAWCAVLFRGGGWSLCSLIVKGEVWSRDSNEACMWRNICLAVFFGVNLGVWGTDNNINVAYLFVFQKQIDRDRGSTFLLPVIM